jgi:uncharacterized protein
MAEEGRAPYRRVSADQHVNEPPSLWQERVSRRYIERVPRQESFPEGDAWIIEGVADPINFGLNSSAGMDSSRVKGWIRWNEIRAGGYDPAARLGEMDADGTDAALNYPTPRLSHGISANPDRDFSVELVRAYNDWLSEYCSFAPDRLFGLALLPNRGVKEALGEYERVIDRPGIAGVAINAYPHGGTSLTPEDDPLWRAIEESKRPLSIHAGLRDSLPTANTSAIPGDVRIAGAMDVMQQFMWSGALDRFPTLKIVLAEVDCGWVPFFKEQVDNRFHRLSGAASFSLTRPPSEYFDDHFAYSYISDAIGIANRHAIGVENILWSDDFPHMGANWPHSDRTIAAEFSGVPRSERELILAGNTARLYHLPGRAEKIVPSGSDHRVDSSC